MDLKNHYKLKITFFNSNFITLITNTMEVFGEIMLPKVIYENN